VAIGAAKWSPDGRQIAFDWRPSGRGEIHLMANDGGNRKALVADTYQNSVPAWSADGRFIYFASNRAEIFGASQIWKTSVDGGPAVQITKRGGFGPQVSPDGEFLYYFREAGVWRMPLVDATPSGAESKVPLQGMSTGDWGNWTPTNTGVYYIERRNNGAAAIQYYDFARRSSQIIFEMPKPPVYFGIGLALSPDGKVLLFVEVDQDDSSIFVQ
jgi:Tol biopolymer transport system component